MLIFAKVFTSPDSPANGWSIKSEEFDILRIDLKI